jgi:hypothetical protein
MKGGRQITSRRDAANALIENGIFGSRFRGVI